MRVLAYTRAPATHTLLSPNRPHLPRNPLRAMSAVHSALLAPDDLLLANLLHAFTLQPRGRHFLWFPIRLPKPVLHRGLRNDLFPRFGLDGAAVIPLKRGRKCETFRRVWAREMCNWIDCDVAFSESAATGEGSECSSKSGTPYTQPRMHQFPNGAPAREGPAPPQVPLQPWAQAQPPLPVQVISHHQKTANRTRMAWRISPVCSSSSFLRLSGCQTSHNSGPRH